MNPVLRPAGPDDQEFLFQLYASTRKDEFAAAGLDRAQLESLLRMQWSAQQRWYEAAYAIAENQIVVDGEAIGRIMVQHSLTETLLVDISLMPEHRGRGIGSLLLRDLIRQCGRKNVALRLQVLKTNPAVRLYLRLGFSKTSEDEMYFQMEKPPGL
jgi:ribosomal protein S18 acetylase RimI-like enzyme